MMVHISSYLSVFLVWSSTISGYICDAATSALPKRLFQLDPVEIGFERVLELQPGKKFTVLTVSIKPPVFEINNFLSDSECDHIQELALAEGLGNSTVLEDPRTRFIGSHEGKETQSPTKDQHVLDMFKEFDWSGDGVLDAREVLDILPPDGNAFMAVNNVHEMFIDLGIDRNSDGYLDLDEYKDTSEADIRRWMKNKMESDKSRVIRESKQVWLSQNEDDDPVLQSLRERVVALTRLPRIVIEGSELLQVVKYNVGGHYHAHYDSEEIDNDMPCQHTTIENEEDIRNKNDNVFFQEHRLCRYVTILYYLNDVDGGGHTAFPLAGNETINNEELADHGDRIYDLSHHCKDAKLRIEPIKGKAVMWYNHHLDDTGWMGEMDEFSLHGGCDVNSGVKWIANNWINVDNIREKQNEYHEFLLDQYYEEFRRKKLDVNREYEFNDKNNDVLKHVVEKDKDVGLNKNSVGNFEDVSKNSYANDEL